MSVTQNWPHEDTVRAATVPAAPAASGVVESFASHVALIFCLTMKAFLHTLKGINRRNHDLKTNRAIWAVGPGGGFCIPVEGGGRGSSVAEAI